MDTMNIDYIKLAQAIAKNTPMPQSDAEYSINGILIAVLILSVLLSWVYFIWEKRQQLAHNAKLIETMDKVKSTMERLIAYFDQNDTRADMQEIKTNIALINQKLDNT